MSRFRLVCTIYGRWNMLHYSKNAQTSTARSVGLFVGDYRLSRCCPLMEVHDELEANVDRDRDRLCYVAGNPLQFHPGIRSCFAG